MSGAKVAERFDLSLRRGTRQRAVAGWQPVLIIASLFAWTGAEARAGDLKPGDGFEVERYAVTLRPDLKTTAVSGAETIVLRPTTEGLARLAFSPNSMKVERATLDGRQVQVSSATDAIIFSLPYPLRKGQRSTLQFEFVGVPARGVRAIEAGAYTSYFACDWMVCLQDVPGDKAHLVLDLLLPSGAQSLGVGRALRVKPLPNYMALHRWRSTRPYSAYLYGFAAGSFVTKSVSTAQGELAYLDASGGQADLAALFAQAPDIAAFLADKAGLPFPDFRYSQLLVPGREAQEAAGYALIGRAELERERGDPSLAWVISHEMAHQWWGNLVTCADWRDFWLNEGMATFMTAAWREHRDGPAAYQKELDVARRRLEQARAAGFDKPLSWPGKYPTLGLRRAVQYSKGALFLAHLRGAVGDAAFWNGIRRYTRKHAGGTVTSRDFQAAMEESTGRSLATMFGEWVYVDESLKSGVGG